MFLMAVQVLFLPDGTKLLNDSRFQFSNTLRVVLIRMVLLELAEKNKWWFPISSMCKQLICVVPANEPIGELLPISL